MNDIPSAERSDTSLPDCATQAGEFNSCNADGFIITGFTPARRKTGMYIWIAAFTCFFLFFLPGQMERLIIIPCIKTFYTGASMFCLTNYYQ